MDSHKYDDYLILAVIVFPKHSRFTTEAECARLFRPSDNELTNKNKQQIEVQHRVDQGLIYFCASIAVVFEGSRIPCGNGVEVIGRTPQPLQHPPSIWGLSQQVTRCRVAEHKRGQVYNEEGLIMILPMWPSCDQQCSSAAAAY
ncbi:hypothetical protein Ancab_026767 [Ancistrocladus abbreviatus]